jgi:hypothetical protein
MSIYDRALHADEVRRNRERYVAKIAARPRLPHVEVEAKWWACRRSRPNALAIDADVPLLYEPWP